MKISKKTYVCCINDVLQIPVLIKLQKLYNAIKHLTNPKQAHQTLFIGEIRRTILEAWRDK